MNNSRNFNSQLNIINLVNNTLKRVFGSLFLATILFTSCNPDDDGNSNTENYVPDAEAFSELKDQALGNATQTFQFNADDGNISLTSEAGVQININGDCLTLNGNTVTGQVDLEFVELFEKGNMLTTNKPTMGQLPNGDKALLISGGEFFVEATQNGNQLETNCGLQLIIPTNLTGDPDPVMTLWEGEIDNEDLLTWNEIDPAVNNEDVFVEENSYYAFLDFGWTNVDRFYSDPRPKTQIQVQPPANYTNLNSAVYLSYDGEAPALANLDTFDNNTNIFSEHYGQIPIGLECHVIFVTEDNGVWRYAIKPVTIVANHIITFTLGETNTGTENSLTALINALP
ncbi:hypothetical protein Q4512_06010 [Oceanihabitans sp. 2_MG-2023]|uniref:hypothetical protein n=1 Tax=Oceanihabitans sp. 2_MG-2023 TaxID=3062661 RepID=UPI0026E2891C|nr:hypothetical protein [Oceanihabitans sp. 2_MG-2023]MDO6596460.1 hypothetical protein [Oceanihabitans sp. 2_MG-2023]